MSQHKKDPASINNDEATASEDPLTDVINDIILELPPPPDGGYGWIILICSFLCSMVVGGICFTFGVFLNDFVVYFNEPISRIAWAGSLLGGCSLFIGPVSSAFTNRFGCRPVVIVGGVLSAVFIALSVLSPSVDILILTYALTGMASGILMLPANVVVSYYFEEKRALTTCIASCGSSVGNFAAGPIALFLLDKFGWRGANLVLAGTFLSCVVFGVLMKPLKAVAIPKEENKEIVQQLSQKRGTYVTFDSGRFTIPHSSSMDDFSPKDLKFSLSFHSHSSVGLGLRYNDNQTFSLRRSSRKDLTVHKESDEVSEIKDKKFADTINSEMKKSQSSPVPIQSEHIPDATSIDTSEQTFNVSQSDTDFGRRQKYNMFPRYKQDKHSTGSNISIYSVRRGQSYFKLSPEEPSVCVSLADNCRIQKSLSESNIVGPLSRMDAFYNGSIKKLKKQHSKNSILPYRQSVLSFNPLASVEVGKIAESVDSNKKRWCDRFFHESFINVLSRMVDISLLKDIKFFLWCIGKMICWLGYFIPFFFIVDAAMEQGVDRTSAAFLISIIGIANCVGRALCGIIGTVPGIDCFIVHNLGMLLCGVAACCIGFMSEFVGYACCAACFGLFGATFIALESVVLVSVWSLEKLSSAFGITYLFCGAASMIGSPLAGAVYDAVGSYVMPFFFSGGLLILGSLVCFLIMLIQKCQGKKPNLSRN